VKALQQATTTVPIIFIFVAEPVVIVSVGYLSYFEGDLDFGGIILALGGRASWPSEPHLQVYPSIPLFVAVSLLFFATLLRLQ
jgi:hypothetical protein